MNRLVLRLSFATASLVLLTRCAAPIAASASASARCVPVVEAKAPTGAAEKLRALYAREWEWQLRESPESATTVGDTRYNDRLTDLSLEAIARRKEHTRALQQELARLDGGELSAEERLNFELFKRDVSEAVAGDRFPDEYLALSQFSGPHQSLPEVAEDQPKLIRKDFEDYLKRLRAAPKLIDQTLVLLEKGLEAGVIPARPVVERVGPVLAKHVVKDATQSPLYRLVFAELPSAISEADAAALRAEAVKVISEQVVPAFAKLEAFYKEKYLPKARTQVGWDAMPDGAAWYAHRVRTMTTTEKTPEELHQVGLAEVARIRGEMEKAKREMGFKGDLKALLKHLRTDPKFFFKDAGALLAAYRDIAKRLDAQLLKLFGKLPRLPYGISPVPEHSAPGMPAAYYSRGSAAAGRAGIFYANTHGLDGRPRWEMESLTLHEAVPGHHLQIALAQEQDDLPMFRRYSQYTAFVEGWGLYSEGLGAELGLYKDPYARLGRLINEIWRAIRLVVDTGLHSKGWSRAQAIAYFEENAGRASADVAVEVDRYIAWSAQALAYKTGELALKDLRAKAEKALGEKFDVRAFHDVVLRDGGLPLGLLEKQVDAWIVARSAEPATRSSP